MSYQRCKATQTVIPRGKPTLRFTPNTWILVLSLVFLPLLIGLGVWQLSRADEKRGIEAQLAQRQTAAPVTLQSVKKPAAYTRILVEGQFDSDHTWLVDNRQRDGKPGYEVVQPFVLSNGKKVLVNRGWLPAPARREQLPEIKNIVGRNTIFAEVAYPSNHPMLSATSERKTWPKVITKIAPSVMSEALGEPLAGYYLKLDAASTGAFTTAWQPINMSSAKHTGYAVQWFAMALALVILNVFANTNVAQVLKHKKHRQ
ncbi:SURF1 family protein [Gilvimarinus xylanilyticus]|uniref:SURF1-like protein n=1 Tax=Gilvimarinus xylanilyticus TaxID=2944139 RepID=A0A9X2I0T1_9GAMM|nr:SURF1 family protein [Gilvimarinus xylanilyticus]MCP8900564.1 SURF1 family protein [Gilvimarinus xylanilyticus]